MTTDQPQAPPLGSHEPDTSPVKDDIKQVTQEIREELHTPSPADGAEAPDGFKYQVSVKGLLQAGLNGYALWRRKVFTLPEEKATQIAEPWDRLVNSMLDRYLPGWMRENPELVAGVWMLTETLCQIEAAPSIGAAPPAPDAGAAPSAPGGSTGFPTTSEITKPPSIR